MIADAEQGDINIDRSAKIFEHILNLVRDVDYKFPKKYESELGFYGMDCKNFDDIDKLILTNYKLNVNRKDEEQYFCGDHQDTKECIICENKSENNYCESCVNEYLICNNRGCRNYRILNKYYCFQHFKPI